MLYQEILLQVGAYKAAKHCLTLVLTLLLFFDIHKSSTKSSSGAGAVRTGGGSP